ncbi:MAG: sugar phosphate isomerase/epimerase family protein [Nocardioides sp.]|uniref:sugar phosphate isomerase/epimerase family protein n=1 Tax=Nocardioides sp. TaxID=35761 RepID=UPI0039E36780
MNAFKYSFNTLCYLDEDVVTSIARIADCGYDAIELAGETERYDIDVVHRECARHGIVVSSICSLFNEQRDFSHANPERRMTALNYVKEMVDFAAAVEAPTVIVAPTALMRTTLSSTIKKERDWALQGLYEAGKYAERREIQLTIEPWNRYETYWLHRLEQAVELVEELQMESVGVMGDTFHMNIEEEDVAGAILLAGARLNHLHVADSARLAPGTGHLDLEPVMEALVEIGYQGFVTFELIPNVSEPFEWLRAGHGGEFKDPYTRQSIEHMIGIEGRLALDPSSAAGVS